MSTRRILKYPLQSKPGSVALTLPWGAQILHLDAQFGEPTLWISSDPQQRLPVDRKFVIFWTGQEFDDAQLQHIGTVPGCGTSEALVCHVFEIINGEPNL